MRLPGVGSNCSVKVGTRLIRNLSRPGKTGSEVGGGVRAPWPPARAPQFSHLYMK